MAVATVFAQAGGFEFVGIGDDASINNNPQVREGLSWESIRQACTQPLASNWQPVTRISHLTDGTLYGLEPAGHHLTNVALHAANSVLLFFALCRLTRSSTLPVGAVWRSALVAALFAIHPLRAESVAWVSQRQDVLCMFFGTVVLWAYAWYAERPGWARYVLVVLALALGLLSKPLLVTMPFVLLLLDYWPLERISLELDRRASFWRDLGWRVLEKLPLFALAIASGAVTLWAHRQAGSVWAWDIYSLGARLANALVAYMRYLRELCWPAGLTYIDPLTPGGIPAWQVAAAAVFLAALTIAVLWQLRRRPYLAVGWFWFLGTLLPNIGLVQVGFQRSADRYTYLPSIGLVIMFSWGAAELAQRLRMSRFEVGAIAAALLVALATKCWLQVATWRNSFTLLSHALAVDPQNYRALGFHGRLLADQGRYEEAIVEYRKALQVPDRFVPETLLQMAIALSELGRFTEAEPFGRRAVEALPHPAEAWCALAELDIKQQRWDEAETRCRQALAADPASAEAYSDLAVAYLERDRFDAALRYARHAVKLAPKTAKCQFNLGVVLLRSGRFDEAEAPCELATRLKPQWTAAWFNLGLVQARLGHLADAADSLARATQLDPRLADAWQNLGLVQGLQGHFAAAAVSLTRATQLVPTHAQAHLDLGWVLHHQSRPAEAIAQYRQVRQLRPDWPEPIARLAWILATSPDERIRRPAESLTLAEEAQRLAVDNSTSLLDTLAAAYAAVGRYDEAAATIRKALALLRPGDHTGPALRGRLNLYVAGQPYREPVRPALSDQRDNRLRQRSQ